MSSSQELGLRIEAVRTQHPSSKGTVSGDNRVFLGAHPERVVSSRDITEASNPWQFGSVGRW
ncbi:hypothetical protein PG993_001247 [Apiospora rasikravindrae]|uniref:Uncharacterized protein n=1 Tax=Apiospora rasikravindrae TaxID=990691 RepID=A0ABR1UAV8_9PEZI